MTIGIAGPIVLDPLTGYFPPGTSFPPTYSFPLIGHLAAGLRERGNSIVVFALSHEVTETLRLDGDGVRIVVCPMRKENTARDFFHAERKGLLDAMRDASPNIVHAHWTYDFADAALRSGLPALITAHDSPAAICRQFLPTRGAPYWTVRSLFGAWVLLRAKNITTVSDYCARHIRKTLFLKTPIQVIPNAILPEVVAMGRERAQMGTLPDGPPTIVSVMDGFSTRKNAKTALRAFALLRKHKPESRYVLFGTGYGEGQEAHQWALRHRVAENVIFRGRTPQAQIFRFLNEQAAILLHPAREESFGMAPLEAMALGVPVVGGFQSGAVPYVLDGGRAGRLVDVNNAGFVARTMRGLLDSPEQLRALALAGWTRAKEEFAFSKMVDSYLAQYRLILSKNRASRSA